MSKKKKILLIVLAVVLVAGGICWRILPDRLTGGTLKLSEDISLIHRLAAGKKGVYYLERLLRSGLPAVVQAGD